MALIFFFKNLNGEGWREKNKGREKGNRPRESGKHTETEKTSHFKHLVKSPELVFCELC